MAAAIKGTTWPLRALVQHGADLKAVDNKGLSALDYAVRQGNKFVLDVLEGR